MVKIKHHRFPAGILPAMLLVIAAALAGSVQTTPVQAEATTFTDNVKAPINILVFVPCAAEGEGELVELSGNLHFLFHVTLDNSGGFHSKIHFQPQGVSGRGLETGDKYRGTGVTQEQFNGKVGTNSTLVNNFRIIGQGPGNNFLVHENLHVTVNANGNVTASVDNFRAECK